MKKNSPKARRIAMVVFSYYPADVRVRRAAEALVGEGDTVDVICLKGRNQLPEETKRGVNLFRLPVQRTRGGKLSYFWEYAFFFLLAFFKLSWFHLRRQYHLVHVHNMPDVLVFTAFMPWLTGTKVILDLHDPMPEVYRAKYSLRESHSFIKLLLFLEKLSIRLADLVLTPNIAFRNIFISRSCPKDKIQIVMNSPDEAVFSLKNKDRESHEKNSPERFVLMYHGTIVKRHGLDVALKALSRLRKKIPNLVFKVYGNGDYVNEFLSDVAELELADQVFYHGYVQPESIAEEISRCDLGLIPNRRNVFTEVNLPTRIFEFLSLGKPVIAPQTRGILDYFDEESLYFHEAGNAENLAEVIFEIYSNPEECQARLERGIAVYQQHRWELQRLRFLELVEGL
jgi:glycosyltransferase involved in cell wall biosynthesis